MADLTINTTDELKSYIDADYRQEIKTISLNINGGKIDQTVWLSDETFEEFKLKDVEFTKLHLSKSICNSSVSITNCTIPSLEINQLEFFKGGTISNLKNNKDFKLENCSEVEADLTIKDTNFQKTSISNLYFSQTLLFKSCEFESNIELVNIEIKKIFFDECRINHQIFLSKDRSQIGNIINGLELKSPLFFEESIFFSKLDYQKTKFHHEVYFLNCILEKEVNVTNSEFTKNLTFKGQNTRFNGDVNLFEVSFSKLNIFDATFNSNLSLLGVDAQNKVNIEDVTIQGEFNLKSVLSFSEKVLNSLDIINCHFFKKIDLTEILIKSQLVFKGNTCNGEAFFNKSTYQGDLNIIDSKFDKEFILEESNINGNLTLDEVKAHDKFTLRSFGKSTNIANSTFGGDFYMNEVANENVEVLFSKTSFQKAFFNDLTKNVKFTFQDTQFYDETVFDDSRLGAFKITKSTFHNRAIFIRSAFQVGVFSLANVTFIDQLILDQSTIAKAIINKCQFHKTVDFSSMSTLGPIEITDQTVFKENVNLSHQIFQNLITFNKATFEGSITLEESTFKDKVRFHNCLFKDSTNFYNTKFNELIDFWASTFDKTVIFLKTDFFKTTVFSRAVFKENVLFTYTRIDENLILRRAKFEKGLDLSLMILNGKFNPFDLTLEDYDIVKGELSNEDYRIKVEEEGKIPIRNKRETFKLLKKQLADQGDRIEALKFADKENQTFFTEVRWSLARIWPKENFNILRWWGQLSNFIIFSLNFISNLNGKSWLLGIFFTIIAGGICWFFMIESICPDFTFVGINDPIFKSLVEFYNPTHSFDYLSNYSEDYLNIHGDECDKIKTTTSTYIFDFLGRLIIAYGIYQTVLAFRRFTRNP